MWPLIDEEVGAGGREVDRQVADRLHGVGVERHAGLVGDGGELGHRLDRADLVVGPHDADERDVVGVLREDGAQVLDGDVAAPVGLEPGDLGALVVLDEVLDAVEDGVVLDAADDEPGAGRVGVAAGGTGALDGEVVGLGAAGGEDDLGRPGAEDAGDPLARLLDDARGPARPEVCSDEALPTRAACSVEGLDGGGSIGVVAAWSR